VYQNGVGRQVNFKQKIHKDFISRKRYNSRIHMNYWLIKSEGDCYSIDDFAADCVAAKKSGSKTGSVPWTGIRNYQARNFMRDGELGPGKGMHIGDLALFYHSNGKPDAPAGVYGIAEVTSKPHEDETAYDKKDMHYDPRAVQYKKEGKEPLWSCVDMTFVEKLTRPISLAEIKLDPSLSGMLVAKTGQRLSVMPVSEKHFKRIVELGKRV
jgi:predicted RNA-binding protein with PUA-like domain